MSVYSDMKFAQNEDEYNALKVTAEMEAQADEDYGYNEFSCDDCFNYNKCKKDPDERCEIWYEEGRE